MRLSRLLEGFAGPVAEEVEVCGLSLNSRTVKPGDAFLAVRGTRHDGLRFAEEAIRRGCVAVIHDAEAPRAPGQAKSNGIVFVRVPHLAENAGELASRFFGHPSRRLTVIGVTGTNGKTSCVQLLAHALNRRAPAGSIGTLGAGPVAGERRLANTTPDPVAVHRSLSEMQASGVKSVAMEVSSHALDQGRVAGVAFAAAVFTNLSRDHLDYHGDMDRYAAAKARLLAWPGLRFAILNADDPHLNFFRERVGDGTQYIEYGMHGGDYRAEELRFSPDGVAFRLRTPAGTVDVQTRLLGRFNVANLLATAATLGALGWSPADLREALAAARPVPGRINALVNAGQPTVVIDYAHTPDALEKCLEALREHGFASITCVFGCGGERDRGKRPAMAAAAERLADRLIVTDDNPRYESGDRIIADILAGLAQPDAVRVIRDRAAAIAAAIAGAGPGDLVLIAGKGHEDYQEIRGERRSFDDRREALRALEGTA